MRGPAPPGGGDGGGEEGGDVLAGGEAGADLGGGGGLGEVGDEVRREAGVRGGVEAEDVRVEAEAGAAEADEAARADELRGAAPAVQAGEGVRAEEEEELRVGMGRADVGDEVHGVGDAAAVEVGAADPEARLAGDRELQHREAVLRGGVHPPDLEGRVGGRGEEHAVQRHGLERPARERQMPGVHGVEAPAEDADAFHGGEAYHNAGAGATTVFSFRPLPAMLGPRRRASRRC